jgi:hypothetical protein
MNNEPVAYINVEERKLEWAKPTTWHTPTIAQMNNIPLYAHPAKTLTDEEIYEVWKKAMQEEAKIEYSIYATQLERQPFLYFARAILKKAQE